jgi:hypothetical protein
VTEINSGLKERKDDYKGKTISADDSGRSSYNDIYNCNLRLSVHLDNNIFTENKL